MDMIREKLALAKVYCDQGIQLVPLHSAEDGVCSCRKKDKCGSAGKHPRITKWQDKASSDPKIVEAWLKKWPGCNLGVRLGPESNVIDVEFDDEIGKLTAKRLLGDIKTPTFKSARSVHRLFRYPDDLELKTVKKIQGLEIRLGNEKKGAQSVLPPSKHHSGKFYSWTVPLDEVEIADFPDCLRHLITNGEKQNNNGVLPDASGMTFVMQEDYSDDVIRRTKAYVDRMPRAVQGEEGDKRTYSVACRAAIDFGLSKAETLEVLQHYNQRCEPPWDSEELERKATMAIEEASKKPSEVGRLRDQDSDSTPKSKTATKATANSVRSLSVKPYDQIEPEEVTWLWQNRIAQGKLTLIVGEPGLGKTFAAINIAARVSTGTDFPDGSPCDQGKVLFLTCEDGPGDTIRPRLDTHGADVSQVLHVEGIAVQDGDMQFLNFQHHLKPIEDFLEQNKEAKLFGIDPISAFLGDRIDSHNNTQVRSVLGPLCDLAERYRIAIVGITHLSKKDAKAINRIIGSIAFVAAARACWLVAQDDDDADRRLFLPIKNNLAKVNGLAYRVIDGRCEWESGEVLIAADEIGGESLSPRDEAKQWLIEKLTQGPVQARTLIKEAEADGISKRTLDRAKKDLGVKSDQLRDGWCWKLPPSDSPGEPFERIT